MLHWAAQAGKAEVVRLVIEEFQLECNARDKASVDLEMSLVLQYGASLVCRCKLYPEVLYTL